MAANWPKIKSEYVTGTMSYRDLAEKYHIDRTTIGREGRRGKWVEERRRFADKAQTKIENAVANGMAQRAQKVLQATDTLLDKTMAYMEMVQPEMLTGKDLQALAGALRGIKDLQDIKSDLDIKEQEARIANLRRQAAADEDKTSGIVVELEGGAEDYAG